MIRCVREQGHTWPMDDCASASPEEAADELLARRASQTLAEEGDAPRVTLADVLADIFRNSDPSV